jgi:hypothetical protein
MQWDEIPDVYQLYHAHGQDFPAARHARFTIRVPYANYGTLILGGGGAEGGNLASPTVEVPLDNPHLLANTSEGAQVHGLQISIDQVDSPKINVRRLNRVSRVYVAAMPTVSAIGLAAFVVQWLTLAIRRRANLMLVLSSGLLIAIGIRLLLLAYISVTSWVDQSVVKMSPVFPMLILFCGISMAGAGQTWRFWRPARSAEGETP